MLVSVVGLELGEIGTAAGVRLGFDLPDLGGGKQLLTMPRPGAPFLAALLLGPLWALSCGGSDEGGLLEFAEFWPSLALSRSTSASSSLIR